MRLLMLTSSYPLEPGDFRGGFVRDLGRSLVRAGLDVEVAVPRPSGGRTDPDPDEDAPRILWLPSILPGRAVGFHGAGLETNLARNPLAALAIPPFLMTYAVEASVRAAFCDCILAHWLLPMGAVGAFLARMTGKPLVVVAHSGPPVAARIPPLSQVVRHTVSRASWVACVSDSVRDEVVRAVGGGRTEHVITLPMGVDLQPSVSPVRRSGRRLRLLFVGRLVRIKGLDILLRAIEGMEGVSLTVLGEGPDGEAARHTDPRQVRFLGGVTPEEAREAMQTHDALVIPSREGRFGRVEGLPRVLLESWSCGLPVLASATGGLDGSLREHGGGLLFRSERPGDLRRVVEDFRVDGRLRARLRKEALAAAEEFSWQSLGPRWADLVGRFQ